MVSLMSKKKKKWLAWLQILITTSLLFSFSVMWEISSAWIASWFQHRIGISRFHRKLRCFPSVKARHLLSQENPCRSVDGRAFSQGSTFLGPTSHRLSSCSIHHVKFFLQFLYRHLQSQQSFQSSYDDFCALFHWFWSIFLELEHR